MGEQDGKLDIRLSGVLELLQYAPLDNVSTVLDVGMGKGQVAKYLAERSKQVTGTGIAFDSYNLDATECERYGIHVVECPAHAMPFDDFSFDAVVMSHVLEHCPSVGETLKEVCRILAPNGLLMIFVPPHNHFVSAGHVSMGWNVGQLMYTLLVNGFEVSQGEFIEYKRSICGFVRKSSDPLPPLRGDRGDIHILSAAQRFPFPVITLDGFNDGYWGKIRSLNWHAERQFVSPAERLLGSVMRILPQSVRVLSVRILTRIIDNLVMNSYLNPKELRG
jgi:SAM-dependent methyltransferase